jgi:hypothetical protein
LEQERDCSVVGVGTGANVNVVLVGRRGWRADGWVV